MGLGAKRQVPFVIGRCFLRLSLWLGPFLVLFLAEQAMGQVWPEYPFPGSHKINRGPGLYLAWWKLLVLWLLFLFWVKTTDWVSRDCQQLDLPYAIWNPLVFFPFLVTLPAALTIPIFPAGLGLVVLAILGPLLAYVFKRNSTVEPHERVLTPAHIRFLAAQGLKKIGIKISAERRAPHERGAQVEFQAMGADPQTAQVNLITSRQSEGYLPAKALIANAVDHRAEKIMLDFAQDGMTSRLQVDGVWHDSESKDREESDKMLAVLKLLAGAAPEERRKRQQGMFMAEYERNSQKCSLVSQGTKTGERTLISFAKKSVPFDSLEELGMREKMVKQLKELMLRPNGILLFSSLPDGGLSSTMNVAITATDRLLRDFVSIEDVHDRQYEVENVDVTTYDAKAGEAPHGLLEQVSRKQPDVIVVPNLSEAKTVGMLCNISESDLLVFASIRAKSSVEALLRVLLLKVPAKQFAPRVIGVLNQRLMRRLCETCKEEFEPPPQLLKKLGIPAGRVEQLYRHPENPDKVCPDCRGIGYQGRIGIFELLVVDKNIREALIKSPKMDVLQKVARASGHRSLQEQGIATVVQGISSLPELMRVLKQ
jgi:general secretion pathway protein E